MQLARFDMAVAHGRARLPLRARGGVGAVATQALLRAGDVLLDIGARDAALVLTAAARVGPLGHVHVFEAPDDVVHAAADAIARRGLAQVTLHELALSHAHARTRRFVAPLVGARPFGVRIDRADVQPGVLAALCAFAHLRFVVARVGPGGHALFEHFGAAAGWTVLAFRRRALGCRFERVDTAATWTSAQDVVIVRRRASAVPPSLRLPQLERLLDG